MSDASALRRCLITGASSGIGLACVEQLVARGDHVLAVARNRARLQAATSALSGPGHCEVHALDVATDVAGLQAAIGEAPLDLVVANAGVCLQARLDEPNTLEVWRTTMAVNLDGVFHTLRLGLPRVRPGGAGIVVSSGLGKNARAAYGAYCASKHAVLGLMKCVALEQAERDVRVNAVCPGWVETPMSRGDMNNTARRLDMDSDALRAQVIGQIPLGRAVTAAEVAQLILWLASPAASAIMGQSYNISCGEFFN